MTPLPHHSAFFYKHQSGVASDYCLQRCAVGDAEVILCSGHLPPSAYGIVAACRESYEPHAVVGSIFVNSVDVAEV